MMVRPQRGLFGDVSSACLLWLQHASREAFLKDKELRVIGVIDNETLINFNGEGGYPKQVFELHITRTKN